MRGTLSAAGDFQDTLVGDLQKHLTDKMNKVSGRKAVPLAEDEKKLKKKTMRPNGNVWRI